MIFIILSFNLKGGYLRDLESLGLIQLKFEVKEEKETIHWLVPHHNV
jgi:hypothetical protein